MAKKTPQEKKPLPAQASEQAAAASGKTSLPRSQTIAPSRTRPMAPVKPVMPARPIAAAAKPAPALRGPSVKTGRPGLGLGRAVGQAKSAVKQSILRRRQGLRRKPISF